MDDTVRFQIIRWEGGDSHPAEDDVVREASYSLFLNGALLERGTCSPGDWEDLALGRLYTAGLLPGMSHLRSLRVETNGDLRPETDAVPYVPAPPAAPVGPDTIGPPSSSCPVVPGALAGPYPVPRAVLRVEADAVGVPRPFSPLPRLAWKPEELMAAAGQFLEGSPLFRSTGGIHSALLRWPGGECRREDIGRHNAVNKVVGGALRMGAPLGEAVLYTSGRLPISVVEQVIWAGVPVVVSRAAPTDAALALAARWGLTALGFAKKDRMNLYTAP